MNPRFTMTPEAIDALLDRVEYGTLAVSGEGVPYAVPVNFVRIGRDIYFHGAQKNRKMRMIADNPRVSFSVTEPLALIDSDFSSRDGLACPATQFFASVSIEGQAAIVEDRDEKARALQALMEKLQPKGGYVPLSDGAYDQAIRATAIVRITPETISGKQKAGQNLTPERFEMIVRNLEMRGRAGDPETVAVMREHG